MKLREDQIRLQGLLKETITLLCKNGLQFKSKFCVEALIGITTDDSDVFLVNIKENVKNEGAEGDSDSQLDVSIQRQESGSDSYDEKARSSRKRPPDAIGDVSPIKRNRPQGEENFDDCDDDETSNYSANDLAANVKSEPVDDGDLVFVKQEMNSEYDSVPQAGNVSFDASQYRQHSGGPYTSQDNDFDGSLDGSSSGMNWAQNQSLDASNMSMTPQSTPSQGGSQQFLRPRSQRSRKSAGVHKSRMRAVLGRVVEMPHTPCLQKARPSSYKHTRLCKNKHLASIMSHVKTTKVKFI